MRFFKEFFSIFITKKKPQLTHISEPKIKKEDFKIVGQDNIYFRSYMTKQNIKKFLAAAAMFTLSTILIISPNIVEYQIYSTNFNYDIYGSTRSSDVTEVTRYLLDEDFESANALYSKELALDSTDNLDNFYYSITLMELGRYEEAQENWLKMSKEYTIFSDDVQWNLALSYLKTDREKALIEFQKIANNKNHYKRDVSKLIVKKLKIFQIFN
jgi:tetratricopeptide (TPR) repeat protein